MPIVHLVGAGAGVAVGSGEVRPVVVSLLIALVLPACYSKTLHSLRFLSVFSFFSVVLCAACISYRSVATLGRPHAVYSVQHHLMLNVTVEPRFKMWPDDWFQALYSES